MDVVMLMQMALLETMETLPASVPSILPIVTPPSLSPLGTLRSPSPPTLMRRSPFLKRRLVMVPCRGPCVLGKALEGQVCQPPLAQRPEVLFWQPVSDIIRINGLCGKGASENFVALWKDGYCGFPFQLCLCSCVGSGGAQGSQCYLM